MGHSPGDCQGLDMAERLSTQAVGGWGKWGVTAYWCGASSRADEAVLNMTVGVAAPFYE